MSFRRAVSVSLLAACLGIANAQSATMYVTPHGSDSASGIKNKPLATLTVADSGTADAPITYRAAKNQTVRLTGGRTMTGLTRLDPEMRDKVVQADLPAQNITDDGALTPRGAV